VVSGVTLDDVQEGISVGKTNTDLEAAVKAASSR